MSNEKSQPREKAAKLECPDCGVDRLKLPCPRMADECAMIGDAHLFAPEAPTGYKLVPIEPTPEMLQAIRRQRSGGRAGAGDRADWAAWLSAVPGMSPLVPEVAASEQQALKDTATLRRWAEQVDRLASTFTDERSLLCQQAAVLLYRIACKPEAATPAATTASASIEQPRAEQVLRRLLAYRCAGSLLYADDGELQDNSARPWIDFKRDSVDAIEEKLGERGRAALTQQSAAQAPTTSFDELREKLAQAEESISQYQQNVLELAEKLRSARAAQASHAGADTEFAIKFIEKRAEDYARENASSEHDTGATVWHYGGAGRDYHNTLVELADDLRAAMSAATEQKEKP